jgi:hypothetical protein
MYFNPPEVQPIVPDNNWLINYRNDTGWGLENLTYINNVLHGKFVYPSTVNQSMYRCSIRMYNGSNEINSVTTGCNNIPQYFNYTVANVTGVSLIYFDYVRLPKAELSVVTIGSAPYINTMDTTPAPSAPPAPETITTEWTYADGTTATQEVPYVPGQPISIKNPQPQKIVNDNRVTYKRYEGNTTVDKRTIYEGANYKTEVTNNPVTDNSTTYNPITNTYYNPTTNTYYNATENKTYVSNIYNPQTGEIAQPEKKVGIVPETYKPLVTTEPIVAKPPVSTTTAETGDCGSILSNPTRVFSCLFVPTKTEGQFLRVKTAIDATFIGTAKHYLTILSDPYKQLLADNNQCEGYPVTIPLHYALPDRQDMVIHPFTACHPLLQQYLPFVRTLISAFCGLGTLFILTRILFSAFGINFDYNKGGND